MADKIRIGVLFGGQSGEHEVSLVSASAVMDALDRAKYEIVPIGISKQGRWIAGDNALPTLTALADPKLLPVSSQQSAIGSQPAPETALETTEMFLPTADWRLHAGIDVVFPVLHGPMGEDGT